MKAVKLCVFLVCLFLPFSVSADESLKRGAYLALIGGCDDCHTPFRMGPQGPAPDMSRRFAGHPADLAVTPAPVLSGPWVWAGTGTNTGFAGPWGVSFASNLTPHDTGMGSWREQDFVAAMRTGKHLGVGRPILPPMPWHAVAAMTDEDIKALYAFLRSVPAIDNRVPEALPPAS